MGQYVFEKSAFLLEKQHLVEGIVIFLMEVRSWLRVIILGIGLEIIIQRIKVEIIILRLIFVLE